MGNDTVTLQHSSRDIVSPKAQAELLFLHPQALVSAAGPGTLLPQRPDVCKSSAAGQSLFAIFFSTTSTKTQTFRQTDPSLPLSCFQWFL